MEKGDRVLIRNLSEIKDRVKNATRNRSRGNKRKEVAYSNTETESSTENEEVEFTPKELQCLDQGKFKGKLEKNSRNEGSGQQEDVDFTIGQTVELDHKSNIRPKKRQDQESYSSGRWLRLLGKRENAGIRKGARK